MAKRIFLADIDLALNQLLQAKLENVASDPPGMNATHKGRVIYNTTDNKAKYWNGTVWLELVDTTNAALTNSRPPTPHVIATNVGLGAEHTISGAAMGQALVADSATTARFRVLDHSEIDSSGDYEHHEIDEHIREETIHRQIADGSISNTTLYSSTKIESLISGLNSLISGALVFIGDYNAATNSPDLDTAPSATIKAGYTYVVSVGGTFFADESVQPGDMLISKQNAPTLRTHWSVINKNIPDILDATTEVKGIVELATGAETANGSATKLAVTPIALKEAKVARVLNGVIAAGTTTTVVHNATGDLWGPVIAQVYRMTTPFDVVECEIVHNLGTDSALTTTFNFNVAVAANAYRYVIIG